MWPHGGHDAGPLASGDAGRRHLPAPDEMKRRVTHARRGDANPAFACLRISEVGIRHLNGRGRGSENTRAHGPPGVREVFSATKRRQVYHAVGGTARGSAPSPSGGHPNYPWRGMP